MKKKVLLIEDEPLIIDLYEEAFKKENFTLITAENGNDGLKEAKRIPDLILLDILLPGMNGFEILRRLKNDIKTRDIPVIVLTNLGSEEADKDKQLALSLGAIDYLVKSYHTPEELAAVVNQRLTD
jgi:DNA-binding response OmpR family regulator